MATTDARTGFRLPWSSDQRAASDELVETEQPEGAASESDPTDASTEGETMIEAADATAPESSEVASDTTAETSAPAPVASRNGTRPSKFMADLTRAMQAAAESAREETLGRLQADAKAHIEEVHARSAAEAADLRRRADDDVAAIREWSKAEIARIREETETRISSRKGRLESEIEEHAALIERQIERVQGRVAGFERDMAAFFERLLGEDDPTRFASMAASLPEPPPFDSEDASAAAATAMVSPAVPAPALADEDAPSWSSEPAIPEPAESPEAAMAAIQAAAEAAAAAESPYAETPVSDEASDVTEADATQPDESEADAQPVEESDPRLAALEMSAGFAEAEAEAVELASATSQDDVEIPTIADDALAARLAGLVPAEGDDTAPTATSTQVVVTGLVSVASIASFKRHLGRVAGVQSVGVSSGPDGEFVFTVTHGEDVNLRDTVPTLPGFGARVTGGSDDRVEVAAKDPDEA
jgi:hypothetical protein